MSKWWMVRAGRHAVYLEDFLEKCMVTIGGELVGDLSGFRNQREVLDKVDNTHPDWKLGKKRMWASQIYRFANEIAVGDWVLTYDPQQRVYHIGKVIGDYQFEPQIIGTHPNHRAVNWEEVVKRDDLSTGAKNSLGAISSLFQIPAEAGVEIESVFKGLKPPERLLETSSEVIDDDVTLMEDIEEKALEFTKDLISKLDWEEMQELVAGTLRAMGYKTQVSPNGADRGKDIVASPDGFGFENPRIFVEVKHRESRPMGSQAIRCFVGGRHQSDRGLYVSTGGFTKDAYYEAERANIPLTLWNLNDLVKTIVDNYEKLDVETKQLVPLKKIFWPV